jgi:hypothetical protein
MTRSAAIATVRQKCEALAPLLHEKALRRWAACEALALGRGGISLVAAATGLARPTIRAGVVELQSADDSPHSKVRRPGGGRPPLTTTDRTLLQDLQRLLAPATCTDPLSPLLWTCKSMRNLAEDLAGMGHDVSHQTVARLLVELGYSLQASRKTARARVAETPSLPDRNAQFEHISRRVRAFQRRGQPVVSMDTKKKELVADYENAGAAGQPEGGPMKVKAKVAPQKRIENRESRIEEEGDSSIPDSRFSILDPRSKSDVTANKGWVCVGITPDTVEFAVESVRRWWYQMGHPAYPEGEELLIVAHWGDSNASQSPPWKMGLQRLADELGLGISVCHLPPGTTKWKKIEHRMFCHITEDCPGRPLVSHAVVLNLVGSATTPTGLGIRAGLDAHRSETGIKVTEEELRAVKLKKDKFYGEWNYTISPHSN